MRGQLAKILRGIAKGVDVEGKTVLDRLVYKKLKQQYKTDKSGNNPKLPDSSRWERSPVKRAKKPINGDGLHFQRSRPVQEIGKYYADLNDKGKGIALNIASIAGRLARPRLRARIATLKGDKSLYEQTV